MTVQLRQLRAEIIPDLSKLAAGLADANAQFEKFTRQPRQAPSLPPPDSKIADALEAISRTAAKARGDVEQTGQAIGSGGTQASKAERELLQYAQSVARLQQASGDATGAQRTLTQALEAVENQTRQSIQVATQLERVQGNVSGLKQTFDGLTQSLGSLGIAFGAQQVIQFGVEALTAANQLETTEAKVRVLAGSTDRYNEVLALAEDGQRRYGGTLNDNLAGLGSLVNLSNRYGIELAGVDNITRRLAAYDPEQGISGASIALKEFLSSNNADAALSLSKRFELNKDALKAIATSGADATEKMEALSAELDKQGISSELLTASTNTTAQSYRNLAASFDNAKTSLGAFIAEGLEPAAIGLDRLLKADFGNLSKSLKAATGDNPFLNYITGSSTLQLVFDKLAEDQKKTTTDAIAPAKDYEDAVTRITNAQEQHAAATKLDADEVDKLQTKLQTTAEKGQEVAERLSEAQVTYAQQSAERRFSLEQNVAEQQAATVQRLADLDASYLEQRTERAQQNAEQRADIEEQAREKIATIQQRLVDSQDTLNEQIVDKQRDTQARIADLQQRAAESAFDRQQSYQQKLDELQGKLSSISPDDDILKSQQSTQERIADLQQRGTDTALDRQQDYQQKLAELQSRLNQETDAKQYASLQAQQERLNQDFNQSQERAARDEARSLEKLQRDAARDEERARAKAAKEQAELQAQIARLDEEQRQKDERAARDEQRALDKLQRDEARDIEGAQAKAAKQQAELQAQIAAEVVATSERLQRQDADDAAELAKIDAKFVKERTSIQTANDAKLADMQAAYDKEERTRATAFAKQESQLKETLGKQLADYTEHQLKLSLITAEEAARRQALVSSQYGLPTGQEAAQQFGALANGLGRAPVPTAGSPGAAYSAYASQQQTNIYNLNIAPGDPQAQVLAIRDELARIQANNGSTGISP